MTASPDRPQRWPDRVTLALVVLTSLAVLGAVVGVWAHQILLDTDRFMAAVGPTLDDPEFYDAIGEFAAREVVEAFALEARLRESLESLDDTLSVALRDAVGVGEGAERLLDRVERPTLAALAPVLASPLEDRVSAIVHRAVTSDAVTLTVPDLVRESHEGLAALAEGRMDDLPNVYVADGEVRLDLLPLVAQALPDVDAQLRDLLPGVIQPVAMSLADDARGRVRDTLGERVPEDFGQLPLMTTAQLDVLQRIVAQLRWLTWALVGAAVGLAVATIVVARRRLATVARLSGGIAVALLLCAVVVRRLHDRVVATVEETIGGELPGSVLGGILSGLQGLLRILVVLTATLAVVTYVAVRLRWFARVRSGIRRLVAPGSGGHRVDVWVADHADELRVVLAVVALVGVLASGFDLAVTLVLGTAFVLLSWAVRGSRRRADAARAGAPPRISAG